jgi:hypothetical protein
MMRRAIADDGQPPSRLMLDTAGKSCRMATKIIGSVRRRTHDAMHFLIGPSMRVFLTMRGGPGSKDLLGSAFGSFLDLGKNQKVTMVPKHFSET